jgi:ubiquinone/menaquinone biosynthesis C-methylase UbiE
MKPSTPPAHADAGHAPPREAPSVAPLSGREPWDLVAAAYQKDMVSLFARFADVALDLAEVRRESVVLDVATGPGTLAFQAAPRVARVVAIDFAPEMIAQLRERASREHVVNIESHVMDGQNLSFGAATFDAVFSMFGLIFFPDRARGITELRRVVKPGGRAVLASWAPIEQSPIISLGFSAVSAAMGEGRGPTERPALEDSEELAAAMRAGGFEAVSVRQVSYERSYPSAAAYWEMFARSFAPVLLLRRTLSDTAWTALERDARARVTAAAGEGAIVLSGLANVAAATRPA